MKTIFFISIVFTLLASCANNKKSEETGNSNRLESTSYIDTLRPTANGSVIENFPNSGGTGMNYWCAADTSNTGPLTMHLYCTGIASNGLDLYTTTNVIPGTATIDSIAIVANARTANVKGAGAGSLKFAIKENATTTLGTQYTLPVQNSFTLFRQSWIVRPSDGQPFTKTDIDALEHGFFQTRGTGTSNPNTGHIYCIAYYTN